MNNKIQYIIDNIENFIFKSSPPNFFIDISKLDYVDYIIIRNILYYLDENIPKHEQQIIIDIINHALYRRFVNKCNFYKKYPETPWSILEKGDKLSNLGSLKDFKESFFKWIRNIDIQMDNITALH